MLQEEKFIREHDTGRRPFTVPDGYFEGFTEKMMARLAAQGNETPVAEHRKEPIRIPLWRKVMRYAAVVAVAAVGIGGWMYMNNNSGKQNAQLAQQTEEFANFEVTDETINDILDYEQVENQQIAYYLTVAY